MCVSGPTFVYNLFIDIVLQIFYSHSSYDVEKCYFIPSVWEIVTVRLYNLVILVH